MEQACKLHYRRRQSITWVHKCNLHRCTRDIKSLAYRSLVRPSLEYCAAVWDPHTNDLIYQLEAVQRRAARFVKNDYDRQSSVTTMMKELDWGTLADRRKIARLAVSTKHRRVTSPFQFKICCTRSLVQPGEPIISPTLKSEPIKTLSSTLSCQGHQLIGIHYQQP